jgi:accessory gene regulator B
MSQMKFSQNWARTIIDITEQNESIEPILVYAIEVLTIATLNISLTLGVGWVLGVFWGTVSCLLTVALFRHTAGGAHSQSPWRCAMITVAVFPLLASLARQMAHINADYTSILSFVILLICFFLIIRLAPVDNEAAPIVSPQRRRHLNRLSLLAFVLVSALALYLRQGDWLWAEEIYWSMVLGVFWSSFNLTTAGHKLMLFLDDIEF